MQTKTALKPKKRLQKWGNHAALWRETRKKWFDQHPEESHECYVCHKTIAREETTLDHIKSRGRYPALRYEMSNLAPCCWTCNMAKGSLDLEEYLEILKARHGL